MKQFSRFALLGVALCAALAATFVMKGGSVAAASPLATGTGTPTSHKGCGDDIACVITYGNHAIDMRVDSLNQVIARVNARKGLTQNQRDPIINSANTDISGLHALRQKLDDEQSIANAHTDVQNIYAQFRIYAVMIPSDYAQVWLDDLSNAHDFFVSKEPTIEQLIQKYGSPGNTQALYTDLATQVTNAGTAISSGQGLIPSLIPANYPGTKATFVTLKGDLQTAHTDLKAARSDLEQIIATLKAAGHGTPTPTP